MLARVIQNFKHEKFIWDPADSYSLRKRNAEKYQNYQNRTTFRGAYWVSKFYYITRLRDIGKNSKIDFFQVFHSTHKLKFFRYLNLILATFWGLLYNTIYGTNTLLKYFQFWTSHFWKNRNFTFCKTLSNFEHTHNKVVFGSIFFLGIRSTWQWNQFFVRKWISIVLESSKINLLLFDYGPAVSLKW